jgi:hypothetical protein
MTDSGSAAAQRVAQLAEMRTEWALTLREIGGVPGLVQDFVERLFELAGRGSGAGSAPELADTVEAYLRARAASEEADDTADDLQGFNDDAAGEEAERDAVRASRALAKADAALKKALMLERERLARGVQGSAPSTHAYRWLVEQHAALIQELDAHDGTIPDWKAQRAAPKGWLHNLKTAIKMMQQGDSLGSAPSEPSEAAVEAALADEASRTQKFHYNETDKTLWRRCLQKWEIASMLRAAYAVDRGAAPPGTPKPDKYEAPPSYLDGEDG